jgi:very-short-patch-repair endonuclease
VADSNSAGRIAPYFADFCCVAEHRIIELNGSQYAAPEEERKDG